VHFKAYNYKMSAQLAAQGWRLLTYKDIQKYQELFVEDYVQDSGLEMMGAFSSTGCCLTLSGGYRLTANGVSFVYPMDGQTLKCSANGALLSYSTAVKYKLGYHENGQMQDLSTVKQLYAAVGTQMCATKTSEANPGIFMGKATGVSHFTKTCRIINGEKLCLAAPVSAAPTMTPTQAPTRTPTSPPTEPVVTSAPTLAPAPTQAPTMSPTLYPTKLPTFAPTNAPTFLSRDCIVSAWTSWGVCSEECNGGIRKDSRDHSNRAS
jgi:hypothetical protein